MLLSGLEKSICQLSFLRDPDGAVDGGDSTSSHPKQMKNFIVGELVFLQTLRCSTFCK